METILTDMDMENSGNDSMEENLIEKVITAPPEGKLRKAGKSGTENKKGKFKKPLKNITEKENKQEKSRDRLKQKSEKLHADLARLDEKQKLAVDKQDRKEELSGDLKVLIESSAELKIGRKKILMLKKVMREINRDIKKARISEKIEDKILKIEKKINRLKKK
ncbi:MAG: hypothetical protein KFF73_06560 [Cyclobacteriaceae bacterium]|nr:hypothetical protein [Cyclobacteriaceae bacterium]